MVFRSLGLGRTTNSKTFANTSSNNTCYSADTIHHQKSSQGNHLNCRSGAILNWWEYSSVHNTAAVGLLQTEGLRRGERSSLLWYMRPGQSCQGLIRVQSTWHWCERDANTLFPLQIERYEISLVSFHNKNSFKAGILGFLRSFRQWANLVFGNFCRNGEHRWRAWRTRKIDEGRWRYVWATLGECYFHSIGYSRRGTLSEVKYQ